MAIFESLTIAIGTGIAKYLVKEVLPTELQDQISEELIDLGLGFVAGKRHESDPVALEIGKRINSLYRHSKIGEDAKTAVLLEVARTLALANTKPEHLVELNLDEARLLHELIEMRPEATAHFSQDEDALYRQMLKVASEGIIQASEEVVGFLRAVSWGLLRRQGNLSEEFSRLENMQAKLWSGLAKLLAEPEEKAKAAEEKYRQHLIERLDRLEPFGIPQRDDIGQRLKLQDVFVKLKLTSRSDYKKLAKELRQWRNKIVHQSSTQLNLFEGLDLPDEEIGGEKRVTQWVKSFGAEITDNDVLHTLGIIFGSSFDDSESLDDVLAQERRVMIEGLAGSGKSTILQWMAVKAAQRDFPTSMAAWNNLVPFFIRLRQCREGGFPAPERWVQLEAKQVAGRLSAEWIHEILEKGNAIVLVDGVDEMPQSQRGDMLKELRSLVHDYPLARYIVTSRPTAISERQWPEWRLWLREAGFVETSVKELEGEQLDLFVDQWHQALQQTVSEKDAKNKVQRNAANLKQLLRRRTDLKKLATTPLLGAMICALYQDREDKVPRERLKLYEECVEMLLERREEKKGVKLDTDYIDLSYSQKLVLLQRLAYWMLDNNYSAASAEDVESQFADRLPALDLPNISGKEVRRLFVERAGLLQEAVVDEISFRHRTFQEFLAAKEAIKSNNLGVLVKNVRDDQWRETIILATGVARPDERIKLLRGMLKKAENLKTAKYRHQVYLLAIACLETCTELDPAIRHEVVVAARSVFPPHSQDEVSQIAMAGVHAVDFLSYDPDYPIEIAALCIQTLAEIGGEIALAKLADYLTDERYSVQSALINTWGRFETKTFAEKILRDKQKLILTEIPPYENWWQLVPWVSQLELNGIGISDLSPLANLSNLTELELSGTGISDLSPLANLSNLTNLSLDGTSISDLSPLANLSNLTRLYFFHETGISDLSPLANLSNLTNLSLDGTGISDLSPLANLSNLTRLYFFHGTGISDLSPLANLSNLTQLSCFVNADISDFSPLANLSNLTQIFLTGREINDLSPLTSLSNLTHLFLSGTGISDLSPLTNLSNLTHLFLSGIGISDLSSLANLSNLTHLSLGETEISDLSPLANLSSLTQLSLSGKGISDLSPLANLSNLTQLSLSGNGISDLSPLANLPVLSQLGIGAKIYTDGKGQVTHIFVMGTTSVRDIRQLLVLPSLRVLALHESITIPDLDVLSRERGLAIYVGEGNSVYRYIPPTGINK